MKAAVRSIKTSVKLLIVLSALWTLGCAKERPVQELGDPNDERLLKSVFGGVQNVSYAKVPGLKDKDHKRCVEKTLKGFSQVKNNKKELVLSAKTSGSMVRLRSSVISKNQKVRSGLTPGQLRLYKQEYGNVLKTLSSHAQKLWKQVKALENLPGLSSIAPEFIDLAEAVNTNGYELGDMYKRIVVGKKMPGAPQKLGISMLKAEAAATRQLSLEKKFAALVKKVDGAQLKKSVNSDCDAKVGEFGQPTVNGAATPTKWLSKVTVVKTSGGEGFSFVGIQSDLRIGVFVFTKDSMEYRNVNSPFVEDFDHKLELINKWPINHTALRLSESDGRVTNKEEEDPYKAWHEKSHIKVDWSQSNIAEAAYFPFSSVESGFSGCWTKASSELVDGSQEFTPTAINFTIAVDYKLNPSCLNSVRRWNRAANTYSVHYKYSFKADQGSDYKAYKYTGESDPLMSKYGYFNTVWEDINRDEVLITDGSNGIYKNTIFMNRWNPNKTHTFYFAEDFPNKWKWIFNHPQKGVIAKTNKLFKDNGLKIRFQIKENDGTKKFGDLRYSFIKVVEELEAGPLGYGPSDAHPWTGELIAANTMLWTGYMKLYIRRIQDEIEHESKLVSNSSLFREMIEIMNPGIDRRQWKKSMWTKTAEDYYRIGKDGRVALTETGKAFDYVLPKFTYGNPGWNRFTFRPTPWAPKEDVQAHQESLLNGLPFSFKRTQAVLDRHKDRDFGELKALFAEAKGHAFEYMTKYAPHNLHPRDTTVYSVDSGLQTAMNLILDGKSPEQIINTIMYRVAIHEFGHNLNLRHNFYGSVDVKNFQTHDHHGHKLKNRAMSSSVMEYLQIQDEMHSEYDWEAYDKAAIVFAYSSGKVDLAKKNKTRYLFCTDEHTAYNALCNRHDHGVTPSEIALSMVETYDNLYWSQNKRYGRAYWDTRGYYSRVFGVLYGMKKFLAMWTTGISASELKEKLDKLEQHHPDDLDKIVGLMRRDMKMASKISLAFYQGILNQLPTERPWRTQYHPWTGAIEQLGIGFDKIYSMIFLSGDDPVTYDPDYEPAYTSFLGARGALAEVGDIMDEILKATVTQRVAMAPGFISFGRALYVDNAYNRSNRRNLQQLRKVKITCLRRDSLGEQLGVDPQEIDRARGQLKTLVLNKSKVKMVDFQDSNTKVGIAKFGQQYYVASQAKNPYTYKIFESTEERSANSDNSLVTGLTDIQEMYYLYSYAVGEEQVCL